jgi:hypothetical protein
MRSELLDWIALAFMPGILGDLLYSQSPMTTLAIQSPIQAASGPAAPELATIILKYPFCVVVAPMPQEVPRKPLCGCCGPMALIKSCNVGKNTV